jgi:RNA polymerase sigma factor (sigma-70 family)
VKKEITGRGKTASRKPKTYPVDFAHIQNSHHVLNPFQKEVLCTATNINPDIEEQLLKVVTLQEAVEKTLGGKEKRIIELFKDKYTQEEIAKMLEISQPRANFMLKRALKKLKNFLDGVIK